MWGAGSGARMEIADAIAFPHSLGLYYTAVTQYLGFLKFGDEYKVMGLAAYGQPEQLETFHEIVRFDSNGRGNGFRLGLGYFVHHRTGPEMSWAEADKTPTLGKLFSSEMSRRLGRQREPEEPLEQRHRNLAASLQARLEEVAMHILHRLHEQTGSPRLALAGGVAYNSVMNGKILLQTPFKEIYVQPAAGDSGTALGVCYQIWNSLLDRPRSFVMEHAYTGPEFRDEEIRACLDAAGVPYHRLEDEELLQCAARRIANGNIVGWFQGRMEFGPRALGNRSIVVDPRRADMKDILNARIKKREPFRPFAPSILAERLGEYFEQTHPAPTMLMVYQIRPEKRAAIPAVTHVDGSGRLQTVTQASNPRYYGLIAQFERLTGVPVVLNTSFNEDEPIVCTPQDALQCFLKTKMDVLFMGNYVTENGAGDGRSA